MSADDFHVVDIETSGDHPWIGELVAVGVGDTVYHPDAGRAAFADLASRPSTFVCHSNYDLRWLLLDSPGVKLNEDAQFHDTKVLAFMLDQQGELGLDALCQRYLGIEPLSKPIRSVQGRIMYDCAKGFGHCPELGIIPIEDVPWQEMVDYNGQDLWTTAALYKHLRQELQDRNMWDRYFLAEEAPLSKLIVEMEVSGMPIDEEGTREFLERADEERQRLAAELVDETGVCGFNLKSPDMVASFLYDEMPAFKVKEEVPGLRASLSPDLKEVLVREFLPTSVHIDRIGNKFVYGWQTVEGLGLKPPKLKKKKGKLSIRPAIDAETLVMMYGDNAWVAKYLRWKSLNTLCRNYLEVWVNVAHNGRLHGRYDQARTETGRMASRDPNMQAIPVSMGFDVRALFKAPMMILDYSGIDARAAAHFSGDEMMLSIFRQNLDLYGTLASEAFGGQQDKSNPNRGLVKILFLSAQYGAQAKSVAHKMRIAGMDEELCNKSGRLLRQFEETLPRLFEWRNEALREALSNGYICTATGRKRFLPNLYSDEWSKRTTAERQVVASICQGTSADIMRRAMVVLRHEIQPSEARVILSVHDELVLERGQDWNAESFGRIVSICETSHESDYVAPDGTILKAFPLEVPTNVSASVAESWSEKDAQGARSYRIMQKVVDSD